MDMVVSRDMSAKTKKLAQLEEVLKSSDNAILTQDPLGMTVPDAVFQH